jgi:thiosulfate/3-mercaptopyruvate sulfurtransferase
MRFTTIIDTGSLAAAIGSAELAIIDCRFQLADTAWGEREYLAAHVPGAVYAHLDRDLSGTKTGANGRHPLPNPSALAATLGRLGVGPDVQVVAYDQENGSFASRLWWMVRWLGHDAVAVLDGGFRKWQAERRPVSTGLVTLSPRAFTGAPRRDLLASVEEVASHLGDPSWRLVDARAPERYRGDREPLDKIGGHIPGALNAPYTGNIDEHGVFKAGLQPALASAVDGVAPDHVICYCGSGVTACHDLLALERAGVTGVKLYVGSWSEWSSDASRPMAKGQD